MSGHDHHIGHMIEPGSDLQYVITGSGCSRDKVRKVTRYRRFAEATLGVAAWDVSPCHAEVKLISSADGSVLYNASIPNYRRDWLTVNRGVKALGSCPPLPTENRTWALVPTLGESGGGGGSATGSDSSTTSTLDAKCSPGGELYVPPQLLDKVWPTTWRRLRG